jgi:hypothetical protein
MSAHDSHALMADEIARLRKLVQRLREALEYTVLANDSMSPKDFKKYVARQLELYKEE